MLNIFKGYGKFALILLVNLGENIKKSVLFPVHNSCKHA